MGDVYLELSYHFDFHQVRILEGIDDSMQLQVPSPMQAIIPNVVFPLDLSQQAPITPTQLRRDEANSNPSML